ncbi:hypothetical protein [Corynebacterium lactis]|uniref:Membrane protein n=1 Tax=Corynebacterium lactis RW2-5 TaxID=1408189 RepID=A0A0K2GYU6_9CORY|nr:hypothetical protein [Corynebacterium lactis]ALA66959.1 membrane protein [Corynebacterium lactis RW2-5]
MYAAFWRALPGPWWVRLIITIIVLAVIVYCLMTFIFPWVAAQMPSNDVSV